MLDKHPAGQYNKSRYGNCTIASGSDMQLAYANPIRYRGYYFDQDTGLYYLNARYYSPELRRFISPDDTAYLDPENANGLNLYAYCCNVLSTFFVGAGGDVASQLLLDGKSWEEVHLVSAIWAGVANAGLALAGKGLSKIGKMAELNTTDSIIFGAMTNSPLLALGMTFNMIISMYAPTYTLGNLGTDALGKQLN